jgi:hypothetical protein
MENFSVWLENVKLKNPLYHGTAGDFFKKFDKNSIGKYDNGDLGIGVYLSDSYELAGSYAYQLAKKKNKNPIVLVVWHALKNTANFNDENIINLMANVGIEISHGRPKLTDATRAITSRGFGINKHISQLITKTLVDNGYDSARDGSEIVCFNPDLLRITKIFPYDDLGIRKIEDLHGPKPKPTIWQRFKGIKFEESNIKNIKLEVDIENLLPHKDDMEVAVDSLSKGYYSTNKKPIQVYKSDDKFIVADGHHRLLDAIIRGECKVLVEILEGNYSRNGTIELDFNNGDYYGLDEILENGWLIKRI